MPNCKVLVVDDDDDLRDSLVSLFNSEGMVAQGARSGLAALILMTWNQFIPEVEQFRLVIQRHPIWTKIPIILCSGVPVPPHASPQVFGVLEKPFDLDMLLETVKRACVAGATTARQSS